MIRRALSVLAALSVGLGVGNSAQAQITLWIDPDGTTYLNNATASPYWFDGYQIASQSNSLNPAGWISIADQVAANPLDVIGKLGAGALTFGEANPGPGNLAELNLGGRAILQPGTKFAIGKPFLRNPGTGDDFFYKGGIVPEPSTFPLATLAGLGLLAFRQKTRGRMKAQRR